MKKITVNTKKIQEKETGIMTPSIKDREKKILDRCTKIEQQIIQQTEELIKYKNKPDRYKRIERQITQLKKLRANLTISKKPYLTLNGLFSLIAWIDAGMKAETICVAEEEFDEIDDMKRSPLVKKLVNLALKTTPKDIDKLPLTLINKIHLELALKRYHKKLKILQERTENITKFPNDANSEMIVTIERNHEKNE